MMAILQLRRPVALALAAVMFLIAGPIDAARAALVTTEQAIAPDTQLDARVRVAAFLARDDVRQQMRALGVDPAEADRRVASLSDAEVERIAGRLDQLPAGGEVIAAVVGAALIVFLVLLVTDLLGLTHIFPFVHHPR
jgi:hypothetical protein